MNILQRLFKDKKNARYKKYDTIADPRVQKEIYFLKKGFINVYQVIDGEKKILIVLEPGDLFPVTPPTKSSKKIYFEALTDVHIVAIDKKTFTDLADTDINIQKTINEQLIKYLQIYMQRVETLERPNISNKLVARLLHFEKRFGGGSNKKGKIKVPVTHEFLASSINAARENVSREISKLQKDKIISLKNGELTILNSKKLRQQLGK